MPIKAKFGGTVGNFNAHTFAYPEVDWIGFADTFIAQFGLERTPYTTQIDTYDFLSALFDTCKRINNILINLCRDMWTYISMDYFKQQAVKTEVGSSTMPHKINPIDFENAEGNLDMANAIFEFLAAKLPISRLQRDLTNSTVLRNMGVPFAHTLIAVQSLQKGLSKLLLNEAQLQKDLNNNWAVLSEAIQTVLRREQVENAYELLKDFSRQADGITREQLQHFIHTLPVREEVKGELESLTPSTYVGVVPDWNQDGQ